MGGKSSTVTQTTKPPPEVMAAYNALLKQANPIAQTPYQPYTGGVNGSGFEQNQVDAFNQFGNLSGSSNGYFGGAASALGSTATPTSAMVDQYMSPYLNDVVNSTIANMNEQNAEQQQGVIGNAIAKGAFGGNRVGVAQGELARQQNLANQATIANLYNTGYNSALGAAQADKAAQLQAASEYSNLGQTAMQTNLAQAISQLGAGTQQQQFNYQQYQNKLSYPFETTSWLANIVEGLGAGMGGTTSTTQPAGNTGSSILGGLLGLGALFLNRGGVVPGNRSVKRAQGGVIPYSGASGIIPMNDNGRAGANDNSGYVPQVANAGPMHSTMPQSGGVAQPAAQSGVMPPQLMQQLGSLHDKIKQDYPNGLFGAQKPPTAAIGDLSASLPASMGAGAQAAAQAAPMVAQPSLLSGLASILGFKDGGAIKGYDAGGYVDPYALAPLIPVDAMDLAPAAAQPLPHPVSVTPDSIYTALNAAPDLSFNPNDIAPPISDAAFDGRSGGGGQSVAPPVEGFGDIGSALAYNSPRQGVVPAAAAAVSREATAAIPRPSGYGNANPMYDTPASNLQGAGANYMRQPHGNAVPLAAQSPSGVASGRNHTGLLAYIQNVNDNSGLPSGYLTTTADLESRFNSNADNGIAHGLFQFTDPTARQYGLSDPYNPVASTNAAAKLANDNARFLQAGLGRAPTGGELYLAHQQGANGALNLLTHPDASAADIVGRAAVVQNGGTPDMTAGQFANLWLSKYNAASGASPEQKGINSGILGDLVYHGEANGIANPVQPIPNATPLPGNPSDYIQPVADRGVVPSGAPTVLPGSIGNTPPGISGMPSFEQSPQGQGVLSPLLHGQIPHLTNDQRMAMLSAGLGMMASTSPNFLTNIGTGGLQGVQKWQELKNMERENALAQSEIGAKQAGLGLEGQKVDIAGRQLALDAQKTAAEIAQTQANIGLTGVEAASKRWMQTVTPAGIIVRDMLNPTSPPQLISWQQLQAANTVPQPAAGQGAPSVPGGTATPATAENAPAAAPVTPGAAPQGATSPAPPPSTPVADHSDPSEGFITDPPANTRINGMLFSPVGQKVVEDMSTKTLDDARAQYQVAQATRLQINQMKDAIANLPQSGSFLTPGAGATSRAEIAKTLNSIEQAAGLPLTFDPKAIGSVEELNKLTTRLGFDLARTLGSREAAMIVQQAKAAVPGADNTPQGFKRLTAAIEAMAQRQNDYYVAAQKWAAQNGGDVTGLDEWFNTVNPPQKYSNMALYETAVTPKTQADIDNAPKGTMFNINGKLMVK